MWNPIEACISALKTLNHAFSITWAGQVIVRHSLQVGFDTWKISFFSLLHLFFSLLCVVSYCVKLWLNNLVSHLIFCLSQTVRYIFTLSVWCSEQHRRCLEICQLSTTHLLLFKNYSFSGQCWISYHVRCRWLTKDLFFYSRWRWHSFEKSRYFKKPS